jgi:hypothetical protein
LTFALKLPYFCNLLRLILTYHLTFLLLVTNVGIPVFTHICHTQEKSWSSILIPAKSCCQKIKSDGCSSSCHATKHSQAAEIGKLPCCEDQKSFVQLDADYLQQIPENAIQGALTVATTVSALPSFTFFNGNEEIDNKPHGPPLRGFGRQLLLSYGILRC